MDPLRDRIFGLLFDLASKQHEVPPDALRLFSHTSLGVARDASPSALLAVADALPWIAALIEVTDGTAPEAVADMLVRHGAVRSLAAFWISTRLRAAMMPRGSMSGLEETSLQTRITHTLGELAALDSRLVTLAVRSDDAIRDELIDDPSLLAASIAAAQNSDGVSSRFAAALGLDGERVDARPLMVLADLEAAWDGGIVRTQRALSERTRRFEISACDHLRQAGFVVALRAALVYGNIGWSPTRIKNTLESVATFATDPALRDLALALAVVRGAVLDVALRHTSSEPLDSWVHYLRSARAEIARTHRISEREAASFANFCLHVMNFCDLVVTCPTEGARDSMMVVEEALKARTLADTERPVEVVSPPRLASRP